MTYELREPLGPDLYAHLVDALHSVPAPERRQSHWVMNSEWMRDIRKMTDGAGMPLWTPSLTVDTPHLLFGLPFEVRDDGGIPHLEPVTPESQSSDE